MENKEINLGDLLNKIWHRRIVVLCFVVVAGVISMGVVFLLPKEYKAKCILGMEQEDRTTHISLNDMPTFQGINVHDFDIPPGMYPDIFNSASLRGELIHAKLFPISSGDTISFLDYFMKKNKLEKSTLKDDKKLSEEKVVIGNISKLSSEEIACINYLKDRLKIEIGRNTLGITAIMSEPYLVAGLLQESQELFQQYIISYKTAKIQSALDFVEKRSDDIRIELEKKQMALFELFEKNKKESFGEFKIQEKILTNDYELFFNLYSDALKQREKIKIKLKENMPVLTILEPVIQPTLPFKPQKKMIVLVSLLIGGFLGCCVALILPTKK